MTDWQGYGEQGRPPGVQAGGTDPADGTTASGPPSGQQPAAHGSGASAYGQPGQDYPPAGYPPSGYVQSGQGSTAGYGQPGYGQPGHGQSGPGQPYGYQYAGPPQVRGTNTMAIVALVLAFVFAPLGVIFGIIARRQIRQTGEEGDGLALAGLIIGGIFTALYVLAILFFIIALVAVGTTASEISSYVPSPTPS